MKSTPILIASDSFECNFKAPPRTIANRTCEMKCGGSPAIPAANSEPPRKLTTTTVNEMMPARQSSSSPTRTFLLSMPLRRYNGAPAMASPAILRTMFSLQMIALTMLESGTCVPAGALSGALSQQPSIVPPALGQQSPERCAHPGFAAQDASVAREGVNIKAAAARIFIMSAICQNQRETCGISDAV